MSDNHWLVLLSKQFTYVTVASLLLATKPSATPLPGLSMR